MFQVARRMGQDATRSHRPERQPDDSDNRVLSGTNRSRTVQDNSPTEGHRGGARAHRTSRARHRRRLGDRSRRRARAGPGGGRRRRHAPVARRHAPSSPRSRRRARSRRPSRWTCGAAGTSTRRSATPRRRSAAGSTSSSTTSAARSTGATCPAMDDAHWHGVLDLNLSSAFYASRAALAVMPDGGRIITIGAQAARSGGGTGDGRVHHRQGGARGVHPGARARAGAAADHRERRRAGVRRRHPAARDVHAGAGAACRGRRVRR